MYAVRALVFLFFVLYSFGMTKGIFGNDVRQLGNDRKHLWE